MQTSQREVSMFDQRWAENKSYMIRGFFSHFDVIAALSQQQKLCSLTVLINMSAVTVFMSEV